jgi:hypothetical protein
VLILTSVPIIRRDLLCVNLIPFGLLELFLFCCDEVREYYGDFRYAGFARPYIL